MSKIANRLDESLSTEVLRKSITGNTNTAIDATKIKVTSNGTIQSSQSSTNNNSHSKDK